MYVKINYLAAAACRASLHRLRAEHSSGAYGFFGTIRSPMENVSYLE